MADDAFVGPSLGYAWPIALSSFVDKPQYTVTAQCNQITYAYANQLINLYADVGDQGTGRDFSASALFRPQPGLLLAVRYCRMPNTVAGRYYQQRFGLLFTEESFQKYCGGRFEALPDPFDDLNNKLFKGLETPDSIDLENHTQKKYGHSAEELHKIWLEEDVSKVVELASSTQRPRLLEMYLAALASDSPLVIHGLDQSEDQRLETLLAIRPYLPLQARSYLTFVSNVPQPESVGKKATFLGLSYGLSVSDTMRSEFHLFDSSSGNFVKGPDSETATKTAGNLMDALLQLPPAQYLQNTDGYLDNSPVDNDPQLDKMQRIWQLGAHYRGLVVTQFGDATSATDYLEEYCSNLSNPTQRMKVVSDVLDKCVEELDVDNLGRTVRILAANEIALTVSSPSISLSDEVSRRMVPIIADGGFSLVDVVDIASEVWSESKVHHDPWANLLVEIVSQSAADQELAELKLITVLNGPGQLLNTELNSARFFGRVIQKTNNDNLRAAFVRGALGVIKSPESASTFIGELDDKTLPWHVSMFQSNVDESDDIWEFILSSIDNNDGLVRTPEIAGYVGCALSISPELAVPSSFWQRLLERQQSEGIPKHDILGLLRLFLLGEDLRHRLDWQPETLDVLVSLIPESDCELAGPLLEIPPSFSPAVYRTAASILAEGSKAGKLNEVIPELTDRLGLLQGDGVERSLEFISLLASNINRATNAQFDPLIDLALLRTKTSEIELFSVEQLEIIAGELEGYFGRDARWLGWFQHMTTRLQRQDFTGLSLELNQMMERGLGWDYAVREGTRLWLEKGVKNTGEAEGLLKQWFSTMIDGEKFQDVQNVLPPIVHSFVQPEESIEIAATFLSLVKNAWGEIQELTSFFRDDTYFKGKQPQIIQFVTQMGLRDSLSKTVYYLYHQSEVGSPLANSTAAIYQELDNPEPRPNPEMKELGERPYRELSNAAIAMLIVHEAKAVLEGAANGTSLEIKRGINRAIMEAWSPYFADFKSEISQMVHGEKKEGATLDDLLQYWF